MGTNFYWNGDEERIERLLDDQAAHIGKRSAAGLYCWDDNLTLCKYGEQGIHYGGENRWYSACPKCGKTRTIIDPFKSGSVAVELGFAKPAIIRPTGVATCASFSWAQDPDYVRRRCGGWWKDMKLVRNEYGDTFTGQEFLDILATNCPIEFTDSIGQEFS